MVGETWRCPGCRDTTNPMGMCQKCGIFGLRYEAPVPAGLEAGRQAAKAAADKLGLCGAWLGTDDDGTGWVCVLPPHEAGDHRGITVSTGDERLREALGRLIEYAEARDTHQHLDDAECWPAVKTADLRAALNETPEGGNR